MKKKTFSLLIKALNVLIFVMFLASASASTSSRIVSSTGLFSKNAKILLKSKPTLPNLILAPSDTLKRLLTILNDLNSVVNKSKVRIRNNAAVYEESQKKFKVTMNEFNKLINENQDIVNVAVGDEGVTEDQNNKNPKSAKVAVDEPGVVDNKVKPTTRQTQQSSFGTRTAADDNNNSTDQAALKTGISTSRSNIKNFVAALETRFNGWSGDCAGTETAINNAKSNIKNLMAQLNSLSFIPALDAASKEAAKVAINESNNNLKNLLVALDPDDDDDNILIADCKSDHDIAMNSIRNLKRQYDWTPKLEGGKEGKLKSTVSTDDWSQTGAAINGSNSNIKNQVARVDEFNRKFKTISEAVLAAINGSNSNIKNLRTALIELDETLNKTTKSLSSL